MLKRMSAPGIARRRIEVSDMKKLLLLSFLSMGLASTMSAMNSEVASQKAITITTVTTNDSAWPEPGNPVPPYDK